MYAIINGRLCTSSPHKNQQSSHWLEEHAVIIKDQCILDIVPQDILPTTIATIDAQGLIIAPAFIDLQLNGCAGVMFNDDPSLETLRIMHQSNLETGTGSFLPTLITDSDEKIQQALNAIQAFKKEQPQIQGLHLEGPWLSPDKKGVHSAEYIRHPNDALLQLLCDNAQDIAILTLAPEVVSTEHILMLSEHGIKVSLGHSNANYKQAQAAFKQGASMVTHLYNAMSPIMGREPGLVGAALENTHCYCGIICDGLHVHPTAIRLAHKLKGKQLCLVTDATAAANSNIEQFNFVAQTVYVHNGLCSNKDGTLGGSSLSMLQAVQNCYQQVGLSLEECLKMASTYPAHALGIEGETGSLKKSLRADICGIDINDGTDLKLKLMISNGVVIQQ